MSLSMPAISSPLLAKNRAASAPIRPAEPVITATAIPPLSSLQYDLELSAVFAEPPEDFVEYAGHREVRVPTGRRRHRGIVRDIVRDVDRIGFGLRGDNHAAAGAFYTGFGQLREGHATFGATTHIVGFTVMGRYLHDLISDQAIKVVDVKSVAHLQPGAA